MNYLNQLQDFYRRLDAQPLSTSAIALWHAIMIVSNNIGWKNPLNIPISTLSNKSGLTQRTISNALKQLEENGLIIVKHRKGNQSATYIIEDLSANYVSKDKQSISEKTSKNSSIYNRPKTKKMNLLQLEKQHLEKERNGEFDD